MVNGYQLFSILSLIITNN